MRLEARGRRHGEARTDRHDGALLARSEVLRLARTSRCRGSSTCCARRPCCARACEMKLTVEATGEKEEWYYTGGLGAVPASSSSARREWLPEEPFAGHVKGEQRERRLGLLLGAGCGDAGRRELRQPDPDAAGRHARQRPALGRDRRRARVLRVPQPGAARPQAGARGCLERRRPSCCRCSMHEPAVRRPDQGAAVVARVRGVRLRRREGRVRAVAQPAPGGRRADRAARDQQCAGAHQGGRAGRRASASRRARRCPASSPTARCRSPSAASCSWSRAIRPAAPPSRRATASSRRSCRCAARS